MNYDDPSATAGQFLLCFYLLSYKPCLNCFPFWRYAGFHWFSSGGGQKEASCCRIRRLGDTASRSHITGVLPRALYTDWNDRLHYFFINNLYYPSSLNKNVFLWSAWQQRLSCLLKMLQEIWHFISARPLSAESYSESANKQAERTWRHIYDLANAGCNACWCAVIR